ncbi:MAG: hypothetical protein IPM36_07535 [Lewinellaceae bacterium]|nr:hypothetical protein [Lewinellaceae bacterium]
MTGPSISVASAGTYTATQSNACGQSTASNSIAVSIGQAPASPTITAGGATSLCPGETVTLTAANVCGTCTVNWSNGMTGPSISVASAGTYTATQSNACGQSTASNSIAVSIGQAPTSPTITAGGATSLCPGEIVTLTAANVCGTCTVNWSNGMTGPSISVASAGTYTATQSNACGQSTASNSIAVTIGQAPASPTITAGGPTSLCPDETVTLTAANVCGTCTVNWSNGMTGPSISVASAGTYTATQSNACGQSTTSNSIAVTIGQAPASPTITAGGPTSLCPGETVTLTAANVCGTCTVNWSNGMTGPSISVASAGTYTATQSNACGQSQVSNVIAVSSNSLPPIPLISANGSTALCPGQSLTLAATNVCGGCTVSWSNGLTGPVITISNAGAYTARYENSCGEGPVSQPLSVTAEGPFAPVVQVNNLCYLAAPPGSNYAWYFNGTLIPDATGQFWTAASTGYYYVSMLSPGGCPGTSAPVFAEKCVSGVSDLNSGLNIRLYPNPARDRIWVELVGLDDLPEARFLLYTLDGRAISTLFSGDILARTQPLEIALPGVAVRNLPIQSDFSARHRAGKFADT